MFSSRTAWNRAANRLTAALDARRHLGRAILDLTVTNPTACSLTPPGRELLAPLASPGALTYRPDPRGLLSARKRVAAYYRDKCAIIHPTFITLTASTSESYAYLFRLLCNPGENVLVPRPSYPLFDDLARISDTGVRHYLLRHDGAWHIDHATVRAAVTPETRAIVVVNPHNPTGMFLTRDDLETLREIARIHDLALIVDEVFLDYPIHPGGADRIATAAGTGDVLTFTLGGISKLLGLPQMKLGWIAMSGPDQVMIEASERLEILADAFLSVSTPVQLALPAMFHAGKRTRAQILDRVVRNDDFLTRTMSGCPCSVLAAEGGWYGIVRAPGTKSDEEWALALLEKTGVLVQPGYFFDFEENSCLVLSLLTPEETFRDGVGRMRDFIADAVATTG